MFINIVNFSFTYKIKDKNKEIINSLN